MARIYDSADDPALIWVFYYDNPALGYKTLIHFSSSPSCLYN